MSPFFNARLQILPLFLIFINLETFFLILLLVGGGVSVIDSHVVNSVHPLLSEVSDEKVTLLI